MAGDRSEALRQQVAAAAAEGRPLCLLGGGSKAFYGRDCAGEPLALAGHSGILNYEPTELVLTARAGTPLAEIETALTETRQLLPFEPPHFGGAPTLGGAIAAGLAGPRQFAAGAVRDFVLGCRVINGRGEWLRFGGEVMKNVAGYDVSRLMVGALGTLGILTEVSVKVLPATAAELTLTLVLPAEQVATRLDGWTARALPVTAAAHDGGRLWLRLSGAAAALAAARREIGGEEAAPAFWPRLRDHALPFFDLAGDERLWRLSLPPHAALAELPGRRLIEWGGRRVWLVSGADPAGIQAAAAGAGGHATLFRGDGEPFAPLTPALRALHQRIKQAFDPAGIFNPGRLYPEF